MVAIALLGLVVLIGCQGVSAANPSNQQQQQSGILSLGSASLDFGSVTVGMSKTVTLTATNTGTASLVINSVAFSTPYFALSGASLPVTVNPGQVSTLSVIFTPNAAGSFAATLTVTTAASGGAPGSTGIAALSGTGVASGAPGQLNVSPTSLDYGSVTVGTSGSASASLSASGGSVTVTAAASNNPQFSVSGLSLPVTIAAGQSVPLTVTFAPSSSGNASGAVTFTSNASNPTLTVSLSGSGTAVVGQLSVTPASLDLGSVVVGTSGSTSASLSASGASVTVTAASSSSAQFGLSGLSLPVTIPAGQSIPFSVTFTPQATGTVNASLSFTSNASPSSTTVALSGTGAPVPVHSVSLSWQASSSSNVVGYNIYRALFASSCGTYSKINSTVNTTTSYTDSSVTDGTTYCYATTAVNSSSEESAYSNIATAQIPPP